MTTTTTTTTTLEHKFDKEQIEVLKETFELYQIKSKENENVLKMKEFSLAYNYLTGKSFSKDQLNEIKSEAVKNGAKLEENQILITFDIFLVILSTRMKNSDEEIVQEMFHYFDRTNDGYIGNDEIRHIFKRLGDHLSVDEVNLMIRLMDHDKDMRFVVTFKKTNTFLELILKNLKNTFWQIKNKIFI